ncbi:MAG: RNA polymerase sporulation sigma factor SigK [Clostridia bacterium]|nr:RNA polymerase sporulation sigma factor SigK [Clostridia bacterium]
MLGITQLLLRFIFLVLGLDSADSFPPPLSSAEERELFEKMRVHADEDARGKLIEHNLRLVSHVIRKYYSSFGSPDELLSIGTLGLIKAVDSFKSELGTRFATYGAKCIQNEILMYFRSKKKSSNEVSINETIDIDKDGNPLTYLDIMASEDTMDEDIELGGYVKRLGELIDTRLDGREREIVVLRYGLFGTEPLTQREVAKKLGISRSYVSRIEKRALEILKEGFGSGRPSFDD